MQIGGLLQFIDNLDKALDLFGGHVGATQIAEMVIFLFQSEVVLGMSLGELRLFHHGSTVLEVQFQSELGEEPALKISKLS